MKQAEIDAIKARLAVVQAWQATDEPPGSEMLQASRHHAADIAALLTHIEQLDGRLDTQQAELAESEVQMLELVEANTGLGNLLADVLHDLKEAWGEGEWQNIRLLTDDLEARRGPKPASPACLHNCSSCQKGKEGGVGNG